jgi:hypothetical protein
MKESVHIFIKLKQVKTQYFGREFLLKEVKEEMNI